MVFMVFYRIHQELWRKAKVPCGIRQFPRQFSLRGGHWTFLGVYANALAPTPSPPKAEPSGSQFPPWGGGPPSTANWKSNNESHQIDRRHRILLTIIRSGKTQQLSKQERKQQSEKFRFLFPSRVLKERERGNDWWTE